MKVVIADDQDLQRELLCRVIKEMFPQRIIIEAANYNELHLALGEEGVGLAVVDLRMPGYLGMKSIKEIVNGYPQTRVIVCSAIANEIVIRTLHLFGVYAYHSKINCLDDLLLSIEGTADSPMNCCENFVQQGVYFTERQCEIIEMLYQGLPNKRISRELNISDSTVKFHIKKIFNLFHVKNRGELNFMLNS